VSGLKFFVRSRPTPAKFKPALPHTRRNLRNFARSDPAPAHFQPAPTPQTIPTRTCPAPHFFDLLAAVQKLLKTHN